ncbi:MAG: radical SAM protein [Desulfobacteraceae bacterium]|nr:radical SAM protein [Desulfobacteraceae bacterium]
MPRLLDAFLIGEAEAMRLSEFFEVVAEYSEDRNKCLEMLVQQFPFVYAPAFGKHPVHRVFAEDISQYLTTTTVLSRDTAFDNTFLIETGRGCSHGCRFCAAGYVYRPPRFRSLDALIQAMDIGVSMSKHIGLVGAAVSDLPDIKALCHHVRDKDIRVSFSSLRADALSPELLSVLKQSRVKTATIAPEAGSERLRRVINKGISEDDILNAAERLVSEGIPNLKLYFMLGLPTESEDDINEIVHLCKRIKERFLAASKLKGRIGDITVSLNCFVPKPFTPFQWAAVNDIKLLKHKIDMVRKGLKAVANIRVQADDPRHAPVQAILSNGDKTTATLLLNAHHHNGSWTKTLKEKRFI